MMSDASAIGLAIVAMAQDGHFEEIRERFTPKLRPLVSIDTLRTVWQVEVGRIGAITRIGTPVCEPPNAGITLVKVPIHGEAGALTLVVSLTPAGALAGLQLAPPSSLEPTPSWVSPDYAQPERFTEEDVLIGSGPLAVPGTITVPNASAPAPAVVLLGGSGPLDRDSTLFGNKPFKDLAWGLASRNIVVLRFDKVTYAHSDQLAAATDFTVADEYLHHARAAVRLLREHAAVDAQRLFVLGHSLGGTVAPRAAASEPSIAGLVIMAGGAEPLHWAAVRQVRYLASLNPSTADTASPVIATMTDQARRVDSPELSPNTPATDLPFGIPAAYWLDLRAYNPVGTAQSLSLPILILQGERDYQATVADDLERWKTGLADRSNVTIRVYPNDNHCFFRGTGPSSPQEYQGTQHMDPHVVADIATWIANPAAGLPGVPEA